jgi:hypothetical protein
VCPARYALICIAAAGTHCGLPVIPMIGFMAQV